MITPTTPALPAVSVIVPVYNRADCLARCINSVLAQTFADWELLLVDDGSTDASARICADFARRDPRVRTFSKPNGGVSSARNYGLERARGRYVAFVDSDDACTPDFLQALAAHDEDLIVGGYREEGGSYKQGGYEAAVYAQGGEMGAFLSVHLGDMLLRTPWAKLFRRSIIEEAGLRFDPSVHLGEDTLFVQGFLLAARSLRTCPGRHYVFSIPPVLHVYDLSADEYLHTLRLIMGSYRRLQMEGGVCAKEYFDYIRFFYQKTFMATMARQPFSLQRYRTFKRTLRAAGIPPTPKFLFALLRSGLFAPAYIYLKYIKPLKYLKRKYL